MSLLIENHLKRHAIRSSILKSQNTDISVFTEELEAISATPKEQRSPLKKNFMDKHLPCVEQLLNAGFSPSAEQMMAVLYLGDSGDLENFVRLSRQAEALQAPLPVRIKKKAKWSELIWEQIYQFCKDENSDADKVKYWLSEANKALPKMKELKRSDFLKLLGEQASQEGMWESACNFLNSARELNPKLKLKTLLNKARKKMGADASTQADQSKVSESAEGRGA